MSDCVRCVQLHNALSASLNRQDALEAQVADLKARLKAIRDFTGYHEYSDAALEEHERLIKRATDLRRKSWRVEP